MIKDFEYEIRLRKVGSQQEKVDLMNKYAWLIRRSDPTKSLEIATETYEISMLIDYRKGIADSYKNSGTAFYLLSAYESGIVDLNKAKDLYARLEDTKSESDCIRNLGNIYHCIDEFDKSIEYYEKSLELSTALQDKKGIAYNLGNIGLVHYLCKRYNKSLTFMHQTRDILFEIDDVLGLSDVLNNIGKNHLELKEFDEALSCFEKSLQISKRIDHLRGIANGMQNIGIYYVNINKIKKSLLYFEQAWDLALKMGEKALTAEVAKNLSESFEKIFEFDKALFFYKKHDELKTEVLKNGSQSTITAIQVQFDLEQIEREKDLFEQKNKELTAYKKELEEKSTRLDLLSMMASQSHNVIIITDEKGELIFVNESFERFNGANLEEVKARQGKTIFEISRNSEIHLVVHDCVRLNKSATYEVLNVSETGQEFWGAALITPVFDEHGNLTNFIIIESDISERKKAEEIIEQKNKDITASITYGKRIQEAMLPDLTQMKEEFLDCFIVNQPKDIVSGDFYWFDKLDNRVVFAVADCTGHGVPGAFMSMIGIDLLNQIVDEAFITAPATVLRGLDGKIKKALRQTGENDEPTDGMDVAFCEFTRNDQQEVTLNYAGAYRPLWMIRDNELVEYKADKFSIGGNLPVEKVFSEHGIVVREGDVFYVFTDGCIDLFGGENEKKFRASGLKELLLSIHQFPMEQQELLVTQAFNDWKGDLEQVDDILLMGFKIK
jgi:PAS domain S-box-containing protein